MDDIGLDNIGVGLVDDVVKFLELRLGWLDGIGLYNIGVGLIDDIVVELIGKIRLDEVIGEK